MSGENRLKQFFISASPAFLFVLIMGIVNLFADMTYEGGASLNGQFLGSLGAGAAAIGIIAGAGEFLGYALRSVSGYVSDKTGKYWTITFIGYFINLLAVPAMALAGRWEVAAALIFAERAGRALRKPTVEAMLSYTTGKMGAGWVYALNTALDETGATLGPLMMGLALFFKASYRTGYAILLVMSFLALVALTAARIVFPVPSRLDTGRTATAKGFTAAYWLYMVGGSLFAAGLMSFELVSFHLSRTNVIAEHRVPIYLGLSTGFGIAANLALGRWYDRAGIGVVVGSVLISSLFAPLVFLGGPGLVLAGMFVWGIGYATQDTLLKVLIAGVLPENKRGSAFGIFYLGYGTGWLAGSVATGLLYEKSRVALVIFAAAAQILSAPVFLLARRAQKNARS